jgi:hypothetical protein
MFRGYFWVVGGSLLVATIGGVVNEALLAWNITSGQLVSQIRQPGEHVTVDQHTGMAVVYCGGGCVEYWDLFMGTHRSTRHFSGGPWWPESLDFASDPGWTVLAGSDHLLLWAGDMVVELDGLENGDALEWPVRIRPRQREVVYGLGETLYAFRLADRSIRPLGSLPLPAPRTEFQALSDDGRWLLIVHEHGWSVQDLETGEQAAAAFGRAWGFVPHRTAVVCEGATPLSIVLVAFHRP